MESAILARRVDTGRDWPVSPRLTVKTGAPPRCREVNCPFIRTRRPSGRAEQEPGKAVNRTGARG